MLEVRLWASQRAQRLEHKTSFARCIISMLVIHWQLVVVVMVAGDHVKHCKAYGFWNH